MVDRDANSTTELILKAIGAKKGSGRARLEKVGNISVEQLIGIAKKKMKDMNSYTLKNALKEAAGACVPMGVICEGMHAKEFCKKVDEGVYDEEIKNEKTSVSEEKKKLLAKQLAEEQDSHVSEIEEIKVKEEAKLQKATMKEAKKEKEVAKLVEK